MTSHDLIPVELSARTTACLKIVPAPRHICSKSSATRQAPLWPGVPGSSLGTDLTPQFLDRRPATCKQARRHYLSYRIESGLFAAFS